MPPPYGDGESENKIVVLAGARKETVTMDDEVERPRAKKQGEREAGLESGEECGTEDAEYFELLRIASAVEEARREIEAHALRDLIDPEHIMDAGDCARFWKDRGFSSASEPNDVSDKAVADCAARLFQKPRRQR